MKFEFGDIVKVYNILADEESKGIFLNRVSFSISDDSQYINNIIEIYIKDMLTEIYQKVVNLPEKRGIVIYGTGKVGKLALRYFKNDKRFLGFCSKNEEKQKRGFLGFPVMRPDDLFMRQDLCVFVATPKYQEEIKRLLWNANFPSDQIFYMRDFAWYDQNQYFVDDVIQFEEQEIFVDAGSYNLESTVMMNKRCKTLKKAYVFEPDSTNYQVCKQNKEDMGLSMAEVFPYGTWMKEGDLQFNASGTAASSFVKNITDTTTSVHVVAIDDIVSPADKITYIKMDVEGAELETLMGAEKTILKYKPKLAVCVYHKPEDIVTLPLYIHELLPEYKLYIRHHSNLTEETVLYAVIDK